MNTLQITRFPALDSVIDESFYTLCTNISYCGADIRTILITSRYPQEGKSYVSMNLMRTLAKLGKRVVLVDTDMRASGIQRRYGLRFMQHSRCGLSDYLSGRCDMAEAVYQTDIPNAYMVPAGHNAPNPFQLLETERMPQLLDALKNEFDVVLIDTAPAGLVVDAVALAKYCDGAMLVVSYCRGKRSEIGDVVDSLKKTGCSVLGAVLNNVDFKSLSNRKYYYSSEKYSSYQNRKYSYHYMNPGENAEADDVDVNT